MSDQTRKIVLGSVVVVLVIALGIWWYTGFSLDFMRFFAAELTPTPSTTPPTRVACTPVTQTVKINATATINATGGEGSYAWTAPGGSPSTQTTGAAQFKVTYASAGTKKVLVQSARLANIDVVACTVVVTP